MPSKKELLNENIISLLGLQTLSDEEKLAMVEKMTDLVQKRVMLGLFEKLSEADKEKLASISDNAEAVITFLSEKVPNMDKIFTDEIIKIKQEMLAAADKAVK